MTDPKVQLAALAVLSTIAATEEGCPEGILYSVMMEHMPVEEFMGLLQGFTSAGLITRGGHVATITPEGKRIADECDAAIEQARSI